jgi:hypothetical protein
MQRVAGRRGPAGWATPTSISREPAGRRKPAAHLAVCQRGLWSRAPGRRVFRCRTAAGRWQGGLVRGVSRPRMAVQARSSTARGWRAASKAKMRFAEAGGKAALTRLPSGAECAFISSQRPDPIPRRPGPTG